MSTMDKINQIGKGDKGITRLAFTPEEKAAKDLIISIMQEIGLSVRTDAIGNVIGRLEGNNKDYPVVATGSHLDTVPQGGSFDGVVGVVGALAAISRLKNKKLTHPIECIVFSAEESSRFGHAMIGSKVMTGRANIRSWKKAKDSKGIGLEAALKAQGLHFDRLSEALRKQGEIKAFLELHIDLSKFLEDQKKTIGIIQSIAAPTRLRIVVEGEAAHSGATPMDKRRDALISAAKIVLLVRELAVEQSDRGTVGTVGSLKVIPGAINVIPGKVELLVDIRGVDHDSIVECIHDLKDSIWDIAEEEQTDVSIDVLSSDQPVGMNPEMIQLLESVCKKANISYFCMNSAAGHDTMNMAKITKTGMIFIPCKSGVTHNPLECASLEDIMKGIDVLTEALYQLAK